MMQVLHGEELAALVHHLKLKWQSLNEVWTNARVKVGCVAASAPKGAYASWPSTKIHWLGVMRIPRPSILPGDIQLRCCGVSSVFDALQHVPTMCRPTRSCRACWTPPAKNGGRRRWRRSCQN